MATTLSAYATTLSECGVKAAYACAVCASLTAQRSMLHGSGRVDGVSVLMKVR